MRIQSPPLQFVVLATIFIVFFAGAYLYAHADIVVPYFSSQSKYEGMTPDSIPEKCPNLLVKDGTELRLYNTRRKDQPPIVFKNLEEYNAYLKTSDKDCPVIVLQKEINIQGENVYRVVEGDLSALKPYDGSVVEILDASRDNGYNQGMYPGFDPYGLHIGRITTIDRTHLYTQEEGRLSDNPMDPNWGGVEYTNAQIESGKYAGNEVTKPIYPSAQAEMARALYFKQSPEFPDSLKSVDTREHKR